MTRAGLAIKRLVHPHACRRTISTCPRRLLDVRFSPDGGALYVVDFGTMVVVGKPKPVPSTGAVWRITPANAAPSGPPAGLSPPR